MMAATPRQAPITRKIHHSRSLGRGFRVSFRLRSSWCVARISVLLAAFCTTWLNRTALRRWARMRVSTGVRVPSWVRLTADTWPSRDTRTRPASSNLASATSAALTGPAVR